MCFLLLRCVFFAGSAPAVFNDNGSALVTGRIGKCFNAVYSNKTIDIGSGNRADDAEKEAQRQCTKIRKSDPGFLWFFGGECQLCLLSGKFSDSKIHLLNVSYFEK